MKTFIEVYKGYHIYLEDNRELTASSATYTATYQGNGVVNICADTLLDIKRIIDELEKDET
ncbi:MAG: hypothetical protein ACTSSF_00240 [Candidatus Heimdallarchaeaceae archaeon]